MNWRDRFDRALSWTKDWPVWLRYSATTLTVCAVGIAWSRLNTDRPYLLFFPTIIFCGIIFNRGSGFIATIVAALVSALFLLPQNGLALSDRITFPLFIIVGLAIAAIVETLRTRIQELQAAESRARSLASDRQVLIDELAHRTRNDLTSIVTLLNLHAAKADEGGREIFLSAAEKVRTIARVHRRLGVIGERVVVDSKEFLEGLCGDLQAGRLAERAVCLKSRIESHSVGIEKAVPLGLIVNELVTNAAKHAFPDNRTGNIEVSFRRDGSFYLLCVQDDGVGTLPFTQQGMGTRLLRLLAAQLGTTYEAASEGQGHGTKAVVKIKVKLPNNGI